MAKVKIELGVTYDVQHPNPETVEIGMDIMADEVQAFVKRVRDRLEAEGLEIEQVKQTGS